MTSIWWLRRDLRLSDNPALRAAMQTGEILPLFIIDPAFERSSPRRKNFLYAGLYALDADLKKRGSYLVLRAGKPLKVLRGIMQETGASNIFVEEDYTPYARKRDAEISQELPLQLFAGQTTHHPEWVTKADGSPYTVYTPYSKKWKPLLAEIHLLPAPERIPTRAGVGSDPLPNFTPQPLFPAGEEEAQRRLRQFADFSIHHYHEARNRMDLDGTSALSPYIRFGMVSLRQAVYAARQSNSQGAQTWLNELIWREFYIQILYRFPQVARSAFNPAFANIAWRNDVSEFEAWKQGNTGVPIVDAAMRQLKETGWMHNRARMIVASFLVKDLLIDWRWGESWFMENLLDGDLAANNGGWQWTAGTGTDAAPYFRVFNPVLQSAKFDPDGRYIRQWIPELRGVDSKKIHAPWQFDVCAAGYPARPMVDRAIVKERTLQAYKNSRLLYERNRHDISSI
ncbi:MAG: deoxyribodipyrimidine photo-lyase [Anaerolineales bacterium]